MSKQNEVKCQTCGKIKKMFTHWGNSNFYCSCDDHIVDADKTISPDCTGPQPKMCGTCKGHGELSMPPYDDSGICPNCNGTGEDPAPQPTDEEIRALYDNLLDADELLKGILTENKTVESSFYLFKSGYTAQSALLKERDDEIERLEKALSGADLEITRLRGLLRPDHA